MVLTNFECWAHGGSGERPILGDAVIERRNQTAVDLFNPSALQELGNSNLVPEPPKIVSHLSSNGYYGFAPVCSSINDSCTATSLMSPSSTAQETTAVHMMDGIIFCNGSSPVRRKRASAEDEVYQAQRQHAKRCRFDQYREHYLVNNNNNGGCPSTYAPMAIFPLSMDEDELPVVDDFHATSASTPCIQQQSTPVQIAAAGLDQQQGEDSTAKSNFSCNNRYNDISRCMLSHMI